MKAQSQVLEYIASSLCYSANLSGKLFMRQDGGKISTQETSQHSIIQDHLWPQCSSTAKGRMGAVADDILDDIRITLLYRRTDGILNETKHTEWVVSAGP